MKPDTLDPNGALGLALLAYGRLLQKEARPSWVPNQDSLDSLPIRRLAISVLFQKCPDAHMFFTPNADGRPRNFMELEIVSCCFAHAMTGDGPIRLSWVVETVSGGNEMLHFEARRLIFLMLQTGVLRYSDGVPPFNGTLALPPKLFTFLLGRSPIPALYSERSIVKDRSTVERISDVSANEVEAFDSKDRRCEIDPQRLYEDIRRHVIGLDPLVKTFVARLYLHTKRVEQLKKKGAASTSPEALLFVGPSGAGKSWLASVGGRCSGLPFGNADMSSVTEDGWSGASMSDVVRSVIDAANGKIEQAKYGIIFGDEIDSRRRSPGVERDISGGNVQKACLKLMEGMEYMVGGRRGSWDIPVKFETKGVFWVFGGSFQGLDQIFSKQTKKHSSLGFAVSLDGQDKSRDVYRALESFGMIPEFLNRLTGILFFPPCTVTQLVQIATAPTGVIASYASLLKHDGVTLRVTLEAVRLMAGWACESQTYARGLKTLISRLVEDAVFNQTKGKITFGVAEVRTALLGMSAM